MNLQSLAYILVGTFLMVGCFGMALVGLPARSGQVVPVSVRENPASFRPSYLLWTGWHAPASSDGGGFGFGK
ncbi:MAG: hypothetical protein R3F59_13230 [Myxococcota bacterium]